MTYLNIRYETGNEHVYSCIFMKSKSLLNDPLGRRRSTFSVLSIGAKT